MFGKEKCKMLKEIRAEIARNNDINLVIEECTHQGKCKGTCPACEAEVAYLEEQLEKRKALGKAVCVAGISAAMVTGVVQGQQMKNSRTISGVQGVYQQEPDMDRTMGIMPISPSPEITKIPDRTMGEAWITDSPEVTSTPELPMGTMAPPETTSPVVTAEPTPTGDDFYTEGPTSSPIITPAPTPTPIVTTEKPKTMPPVVTPTDDDFYTEEPTVSPDITDTTKATKIPMATPMGTMAPPSTIPPVVTAEPTPTSDFYTEGTTVSPMVTNTPEPTQTMGVIPFSEVGCYVTFIHNDGTIKQDIQPYMKKQMIGDMPTLTRKGYSFAGWYTDQKGGSKVSAQDMVTEDTKLYAHWTKVSVKKTKITSVKRAGKNRINITWNKISGVAGYRVVVATDRDLKQKIKILYVSKDQKKVTVPKIKSKTRYYISVVGYRKDSTDCKVYGKCQEIKKTVG